MAIILSSCFYICLAQNYKNEFNAIIRNKFIDDSLQLSKLHVIVDELIKKKHKDAQFYAEYAVKFADEIGNDSQKSIAYFDYAHFLDNNYKYADALKYYFKAVNFAVKGFNYPLQIKSMLNIAAIEQSNGNYDKSLDYLDRAGQISSFIHDNASYQIYSNNLLNLYMKWGKYREALTYYLNSLDIGAPKDSLGKAYLYANLANCYIHLNTPEHALAVLKPALIIFENFNDNHGINTVLLHYAAIYIGKNDFAKANEILQHAENHIALEKDELLRIKFFYTKSLYYYNQRIFKKAYNSIFEAIQISKKYNIKDDLPEYYRKIADILYQLANYKEAYFYSQEFIKLSAELYSDNFNRKLADMAMKMKSETQEKEIAQLRYTQLTQDIELKDNEHILNIYLILTILIVIILLVILFRFRQTRAFNKKLKESEIKLSNLNATKDKFFSIIAHDLRGPLSSAMNTAELLSENFDDFSSEEQKESLDDLKNSVSNIYKLTENLLTWSRAQRNHIDYYEVNAPIKILVDQNISLLSHLANNKRISIVDKTQDVDIKVDVNLFNTILRNLLNNSIKFTPADGCILIDSLKVNEEMLEVSVQDNGIGMSEDIKNKLFRIDSKLSSDGTAGEKGTGLGLIICKEFAEKLGGSIRVESQLGVGTKFYFSVKLA